MVDERRVLLLLQRMTDGLGYLRTRAAEDHEALRRDEERLSGLKYRFVTTIEGMVNTAQHVCAAEGWGPPSDNADAMRTLARHGVLETQLADRLARAVRFRNVLVHQYAEVDDDRVVGMLDEIADIAAFGSALSTWLQKQREG